MKYSLEYLLKKKKKNTNKKHVYYGPVQYPTAY